MINPASAGFFCTFAKKFFVKQADNLIYGIRPVIEAITAGRQIDKVFIQKGLKGEHFAELYALIKKEDIPSQHVPLEKLNRLTRKNHQGIAAFISAVSFHPIDEIVQQAFEKGETPLVLVLDRVTDVRNFGAIARSAECAGVHGILVPTQGAAQINADAMKTSAGALNHIPIARSKNLKQSLDMLRNSGLKIIAATEHAKELIYSTNMNIPLAIIMGSEEDGVSPAYLQMCDHHVKIPITGKTSSLNVSVATALLVFEVVRQRI